MVPIQQIREELAESRARLNQVLNAVGDRWDTQVYSEGAQWNVRQLVTHLAISEAGMFSTAKAILKGGEGVPADFDLERYNRRSVEKNAEQTPEAARAALDQSRAEILAWMCDLTDEQIARSGRHASMQILTIEEFLRLIASHEKTHADDIAHVLGVE